MNAEDGKAWTANFVLNNTKVRYLRSIAAMSSIVFFHKEMFSLKTFVAHIIFSNALLTLLGSRVLY